MKHQPTKKKPQPKKIKLIKSSKPIADLTVVKVDIVDWNDFYWEINGTTEPQLFAGHPAFKHQIKATAHRARLSSLQIEERPK